MTHWSTPGSSVLSLGLIDRDGKNALTAEIYPSRWKADCFQDALMTLVADLHTHPSTHIYQGGDWLPQELIRGWQHQFSHGAVSISHPAVAISQGGLSIHASDPLPGAHLIRLTEEHVVLPDETCLDRKTFSTGIPFCQKESQSLLQQLESTPGLLKSARAQEWKWNVFGITTGVMEAFCGQPWVDRWPILNLKEAVRHIAGLTGSILSSQNRSGQQAITACEDFAGEHAYKFINSWIIRPNRFWCPQYWTAGPDLESLARNVCPLDRAAGHAGAQALLTHVESGQALKVLRGETMSAHSRLARKTLDRAVRDEFLNVYAANPSRLKPVAARRASRLAA